MKKMKINSVIIIAEEERNLENPERAIEASKLPLPIYFDNTIKINDAVLLAYDGNKKIIKAENKGIKKFIKKLDWDKLTKKLNKESAESLKSDENEPNINVEPPKFDIVNDLGG